MTESSIPAPASTSLTGSSRVKRGLAEMLKGGVIMDVVTRRAGHASPRMPAPSRSWRSSACPPTSVRRAASPA